MSTIQRRGIVLPAVLGALVLIELLAVGTIALAYHEAALARERVAATRAQLAARSAIAQLQHAGLIAPQVLRPGERRTIAAPQDSAARVQASLERLGEDLFLLRAVSEWGAGPLPPRAALGALLSGFAPAAVFEQAQGALTTAGPLQLLEDATVDGSAPNLPPPLWPASACTDWLPRPAATPGIIQAGSLDLQTSATARPFGSPELVQSAVADSARFDRLGSLDLAALAARADRHEAGLLHLAAVQGGGACTRDAPANWGSPLDPGHPCAGYFPLIFSPASVSLEAGAGQGILVVAGDLTLGPGTAFYGLVLVRGRLVMEPGSQLRGSALVRAGAAPSLIRGGHIARDNCALARALLLSPALNRLALRPVRPWIRLY